MVYNLDKKIAGSSCSTEGQASWYSTYHDAINTTTSQGRLFFNISACFAEFERDLIGDRTKAGLEVARAKLYYFGFL